MPNRNRAHAAGRLAHTHFVRTFSEERAPAWRSAQTAIKLKLPVASCQVDGRSGSFCDRQSPAMRRCVKSLPPLGCGFASRVPGPAR